MVFCTVLIMGDVQNLSNRALLLSVWAVIFLISESGSLYFKLKDQLFGTCHIISVDMYSVSEIFVGGWGISVQQLLKCAAGVSF